MVFLGYSGLRAQTLNYTNYNTKNGLPSSEVHDLYQDDRGYLWIATDRGISRFDGTSFKNYGLADGLPSVVITRFIEQSNGTVWCIGLDNNIFRLIPHKESFELFAFNEEAKETMKGSNIKQFVQDDEGNVRIINDYLYGYLEVKKSGEVISKQASSEAINDLLNVQARINTRPDSIIQVVEKFGKDYFFYGVKDSQHLSRALIKNRLRYANRGEGESYLSDDVVVLTSASHVLFYNGGKLIKKAPLNDVKVRIGRVGDLIWVGCSANGVVFFDLKGNKVNRLLKEETVTNVLKDHENGYWFSTATSGIFYIPHLDVNHFSFEGGNGVENMAPYQEGLWVNTSLGRTYVVDDNSSDLLYQYKGGRYALFERTNTDMYFYFREQEVDLLTRLDTYGNTQVVTESIYLKNLSDDKNSDHILCVANEFLISAGKENKAFNLTGRDLRITDASEIAENHFWVATRTGLYSYDEHSTVPDIKRHPNKELEFWITEIDRIQEGEYIVGTKGRGIYFLLGEEETKQFTQKDGLLSDIITEVYVEDANTYWVCSHLGLNRIRKQEGRYRIDGFTTQDGLTNNDVTDVVIKNDTVWVGTKSGLDYFPISILDAERPKTKVFLELLSITVNDQVQANLSDLKYNQNKLDFFFKAISFRYKDRLRYRYKMIGLEEEWNYTNEQQVSYKSLPPGSFELVIQAGVDEYWYKEKIRKQIYIAQPIYATWYFIVGLVVLALLIVYLFFRFRILSYNRYIIQEILRQIQRRLRIKDDSFIVRTEGSDVKVYSDQVFFARAQGNYVELFTETDKLVIRAKISEFINLVPDPHEYLQISRSTVIRKDKVTKKSKKTVVVNDEEIKIGSTYKDVHKQLYL